MAMSSNNVVSKLSKKGAGDSFEHYNIGPEVRFVGSQINSGNNNLEEQLILGSNEISNRERTVETDEQTGEDYVRVTEEVQYKAGDVASNYYVLERVVEEEPRTKIVDGKLVINFHPKKIAKSEVLSFVNGNGKFKVSEKNYVYDYTEGEETTAVVTLE